MWTLVAFTLFFGLLLIGLIIANSLLPFFTLETLLNFVTMKIGKWLCRSPPDNNDQDLPARPVPHIQPPQRQRTRIPFFRRKVSNKPAEMKAARQGTGHARPNKKDQVVISLISDDEESSDEAIQLAMELAVKPAVKNHRSSAKRNSLSSSPSPSADFNLPNGSAHQPAASNLRDPDENLWEDENANRSHFRDANLVDQGYNFEDLNAWGNNFDDMDVQDPILTRAMEEQYRPVNKHSPPNHQLVQHEVHDPKILCINQVVEFFPGICRDFVIGLYDTFKEPDVLISHILDKPSYPKAKDVQKNLKRKRELDKDEEAALKYGAADRDMTLHGHLM